MPRLYSLLVLFIAAATAHADYDPTENYAKREVRGFTIYVNPEVDKHPEDAKAAFAELDAQFKNIIDTVPDKPLKRLKEVKFWIEWEVKKNGAAEFHTSRAWLKENGYNPDKLQSVEINNLRNFTSWSKKTQPWMVLHELAHSYHFRVLGADHEGLKAAYKQAMDRKLYEEVEFIHGGNRKHYATTNAAEYFAELSEAYFGKNDFFPFTRDELKKHDPVGFELMKSTWGEK